MLPATLGFPGPLAASLQSLPSASHGLVLGAPLYLNFALRKAPVIEIGPTLRPHSHSVTSIKTSFPARSFSQILEIRT